MTVIRQFISTGENSHDQMSRTIPEMVTAAGWFGRLSYLTVIFVMPRFYGLLLWHKFHSRMRSKSRPESAPQEMGLNIIF